jgi:endonuclease III
MNSVLAIKQLNYLKDLISKNSDQPRLAAEGWDEDWKILISIILSAQTRDSKTIPEISMSTVRYPEQFVAIVICVCACSRLHVCRIATLDTSFIWLIF